MTWEIIGGLALVGLLIGVPLWFRSRPKQEISWPPVTRSKERGPPDLRTAAQFQAAGIYVGWLSPGGIEHDGGGGPSDVGGT
jgi:hypothetical protein